MPVWEIASVTEQPETTLTDWAIFELPNGNRHLSGWAVEDREGRVSSHIQEFDINNLRAVTESGRVYQLCGSPGTNADADYTWNRWKQINEVEACLDVAREVWKEHRTHNAPGVIKRRETSGSVE